MKTAEADIIFVPGYTGSGEDHWQTRWESKLSTGRRVEQEDWHKPVVQDWVANLVAAVEKASRPVVLVAHSLGVQVVVQAAIRQPEVIGSRVKGAFLVAAPDVERDPIKPKHLRTFGPYPRDPLPFPSMLIASRNDPFCDYDVADEMAACWGSLIIDAGEQGHLNSESGHGPWPEGLMVFAKFLHQLK
ncbi:MAG: alpha/beta hydrolase [Pseudomonadota bacterium]